MLAKMRHRLETPLVANPGEMPAGAQPTSRGTLARMGETPATAPTKRAIWDALGEIKDDQLYRANCNMRGVGYVYDFQVRGGHAHVLLTMPHHGRPMYGQFGQPIRERLLKIPGVNACTIRFTWEPSWTVARLNAAGRQTLGLPL